MYRRLGIIVFWLVWPLLWVYLRYGGTRTRVIIIADNHVLLVKSWLGSGEWILPGGGSHSGEELTTAAIREVVEETSLKISPEQLKLLERGRASEHGLRIPYACYVVHISGKQKVIRQRTELSAAEWLSLDNISSRRDLSPLTRHCLSSLGTR